MADNVKVVFTENTYDKETLINYWAGQDVELDPDTAARLTGEGKAVPLDKEELSSKSVDELKQDAEALGVDVSGKKSKAEIAKEIANK